MIVLFKNGRLLIFDERGYNIKKIAPMYGEHNKNCRIRRFYQNNLAERKETHSDNTENQT
jgi:hypothetical protein